MKNFWTKIMVFSIMLASSSMNAQTDSLSNTLQDKVHNRRITIGLETNGAFVKIEKRVLGKEYYYYVYKLAPFVMYHPTSNTMIGLLYEYDHLKSNFYERDDLQGWGVIGRYKIPEGWIKNEAIQTLVDFYISAEYRRTNYYVGDTFPENSIASKEVVFDKLNTNVISMDIGLNLYSLVIIKGLEGFSVSAAYRPVWYINRNFVPFSLVLRLEFAF